MSISLLGFHVSADVVLLGAITGMVYGASAVGLVLVFRSSRIINFAHGQIGTLAAAVLGLAVPRWHFPYWLGFLVALGVGAGVGGASEAVLARRLRDSPPIISVIATLGLGQLFYLFASIVNSGVSAGTVFPQPAGMPTFRIGGLQVTRAYSAMLIVTPVVVAALTVFLRRGRLGIALRAASANPDTAKMAGIVSERMSGLSWAIAGGLAAFTAVLVLPARGYTGADFLGPGLLLRALVCVVVARMVSLPVAFVTGIVLGVAEALMLANYPSSGIVEASLFVVISVALIAQRKRTGRSEEKSVWSTVLPWGPLPDSYRRVFLVRNFGRIAAAAVLVAALAVDAFVSNAAAGSLTAIVAFALVGLSVVLVTGLSGQLSLGQFALAGVAAAVAVHVVNVSGNFLVGGLAGCLAAGATSMVLAIPALRIRGLMLAVTSLSFALAAQDWLFPQHWMIGGGVHPRAPGIGRWQLDTGRSYYLVAVAVLVFGGWLSNNIWSGGAGRRMRAVRDNEDAARAFGIAPTAVKLQSFVLAGCIAGLGGVVYGFSFVLLSSSAFPLDASINSAATAVVGGLGVVFGPVLGTLYIIGIPRFIPLDSAGLLATALGWLLVVLQYPGGAVQSLGASRDRLMDALARRAGLDPTAERADGAVPLLAPRPPPITLTLPTRPRPDVAAGAEVLLEATDVSVRFGGLVAVDGVSLAVTRGETVGVIGPNGAGKTTFFETLSGFVRPESGSIRFDGADITKMSPEQRAQRGLIRSFQDAALFPTLTVVDVVALALERIAPSRLASGLVGLHREDRRKRARARELIDVFGLDRYRDTQIRALSTGTRRIAEIACLVALEPTLLLLDEPTSGVAQRETEALGQLLTRIKSELGLTLLVIEHDIPLVTAVSDRLVAMETGTIIAQGVPAEVIRDPQVVDAYLGGDARAIQRSGQVADPGADAAPVPAPVPAPMTEPYDDICGVRTQSGRPCRRPRGADGRCPQHRSTLGAPA